MLETLGLTGDPLRLVGAAALAVGWTALCTWCLRRRPGGKPRDTGPAVLIAHASQSGMAETVAAQTAEALAAAGTPCRLARLGDLTAGDLAATEEALFIVSTHGDGDPPDNAQAFARRVFSTRPDLGALHYGLLALGDSGYPRYCAFGRALDAWLCERGARAIFPRIDMDRGDPDAQARWRHALAHLAGQDIPDWRAPPFAPWRLVARRLLNPGSLGGPCHHLELAPPPDLRADWEAGDLAQILPPGDSRPRDYSIASLPADGHLHLLVRVQQGEDGRPGLASGWLGGESRPNASPDIPPLRPGDPVPLRIRVHRNFRIGDNAARPLILIGNGTGLAGLRAHLRQRARQGKAAAPCWLLFGERQRAHDFFHQREIEHWQQSGLLARVDLAFSRDQIPRRHVQHLLADAAEALRDWVGRGAAIYVCGNAVGMAPAVDAVIVECLGQPLRDALLAEGRYRRDVY